MSLPVGPPAWLEPVEVFTGRPHRGVVHLWDAPERALCGSTETGHDECEGTGPAEFNGWPFAVEPFCPECFRPVCPTCLERRARLNAATVSVGGRGRWRLPWRRS